MNKTVVNKINEAAELLGWSVSHNSGEFEFQTYSPAGQDFNINVTAYSLYELSDRVSERYDDFDCSEEAYLWLDESGHGRNGAPYVAAGINYTLRDETHPEASVYSQSQEIKASIPAMVAEAERLGYHLDRMAISGGSSGSTLALLYAYRDTDTSPIPVKMVFEAVGPASFHHKYWNTYGLDQSPEAAANLFSVMSGTPSRRK
ncbi:hypothetical protein LJB90_00600 [Eubacteriales bacterium OttesenSCG-928-G02]|nr:hypothetical protein [Eubacteriales bacterium OttesenSCG-928-G02]